MDCSPGGASGGGKEDIQKIVLTRIGLSRLKSGLFLVKILHHVPMSSKRHRIPSLRYRERMKERERALLIR